MHVLYDIIYWLMSLNKEQNKKQGVFINFKDFKGKIDDAMAKMIKDLKNFGLPNIKNIKVETLRQGHGEIVCQLIDELVNLELYRRDFEFQKPTFPLEDENEQSGEEEEDENE
jgi:hypothetical protein